MKMDQKALYIDECEKKGYRVYFLSLFLLTILSVILSHFFPGVRRGSHYWWSGLCVLTSFYVPYTLASKYAHCPGCKGRYLPKKIYDREEMKKTVKENPVCSECGYRAVIISKYQELL